MPAFANLTRYIERRLVSPSNTTVYEWFTTWMPTEGIDNIRAVLKSKNATSANFNFQLAIQYTAVRGDNPGAPSTLGTLQSGSVEYQTGDVSVSNNMATNRLFRLGIAYASATASVQSADVCLQASWKQVGTNLGGARVICSLSEPNNVQVRPVTGWMPATIMSKIKAAFTLTSITPADGNFKYKLVYQTAGTMVQQPKAWTDAELNFTQPTNGTSFDEHNTGEIALTTTDMWFRLGVSFGQAGIDTNHSAVLDAFLSCR
jgi:hypothetical protein